MEINPDSIALVLCAEGGEPNEWSTSELEKLKTSGQVHLDHSRFILKGSHEQRLTMKDEKFHQNWYQVRIFTKVPMPQQYIDLLVRVAKPFVQQAPALRFFFNYYYSQFDTDDADTNIQALPPAFHFADPKSGRCHSSLRLRFRERKDERLKLVNLLSGLPDFWHSEILPCTPEGVLPPDRFATDQQPIPRARRIRLVAELLQANCRLVLDNLRQDANGWSFQENQHDENKRIGSVVKSVEHMILNVWRRNDGTPFPIFGFDPGTVYPL